MENNVHGTLFEASKVVLSYSRLTSMCSDWLFAPSHTAGSDDKYTWVKCNPLPACRSKA